MKGRSRGAPRGRLHFPFPTRWLTALTTTRRAGGTDPSQRAAGPLHLPGR